MRTLQSISSPFLTTAEAAAYCRVSLTTIQELLRRKQIPAIRVGRQWRILKSNLDRYLGVSPDGAR